MKRADRNIFRGVCLMMTFMALAAAASGEPILSTSYAFPSADSGEGEGRTQSTEGVRDTVSSREQLAGSQVLPFGDDGVVTLTGRVVAQWGHAPLSGVLVRGVTGDGSSTLTDDEGVFTLQVPTYCSAIEVTTPGYSPVRVGIGHGGRLRDIVLQSESVKPLLEPDDDAMPSARATDFGFSHAMNVATAIGGQLGADVYSTERGGLSAIGSYMLIDGVNSLNANAQPLVVIDDVITDMQYGRSMIHSGFYNDVLSNFNVYDIESVEVLRGANALYGAKGANGVILIRTKRNTSLATRIDAFSCVGVEQEPRSYSVMNGAQYKNYASSLLATTGSKLQSFKFLDARPDYYWYNKYNNDTDWSREVFQPALRQRYGLTVQGGGEVANYMLSIGYNHSDETIQQGDYNRMNMRFNTDIRMTRDIDVRFDASFSNTTRKVYDTGAATNYAGSTITQLNFLAAAKAPMLSPYSFVASDEGPGIISDQHLDNDTEDYLAEVSQLRNSNYELANPAAILHYGTAPNKNYFDNSLVNIAITPSWRIDKSLRLSSLFSYSLVNTNEKRYVPMNGVPAFYVEDFHQTMENMIGSLYSKQSSIYSDTKARWHTFAQGHDVDVTGGFRFMRDGYALTQQAGYNTGSDKTPLISNTMRKRITGTHEDWATMAWYGEARYNYANRYYLQGDLSVETHSQFGREARGGLKMAGVVWGVFPSVQTGWVMTNERWFDVANVDYLRLSAGYGLTGNDNLPYDASKSYFKSELFLDEIPAIALANIGNTGLKWETTRKVNAGAEARFFHNRLEVGYDFFRSWTSDLLVLRTLNFLTGDAQNWSNGGGLENVGMSVKTNVRLISGNRWNWSAGFTMGGYRGTLTALPDMDHMDTEVLGGIVRSQVGRSINSFYGLKTAPTDNGTCVFATTEEAEREALYRLAADGVTKTFFGAGDVKYVDRNGDGCIGDDDRFFIGDATPDAYGNLFTSLAYRNLKLDVGFNYRLGGDIYNYTRQQLESGSRFMNQTTAMTRRWCYEGQVTDVPRATYGDTMGNSAFSDRWIEDGSYLKLKEVTLSYRLPINNTYIQGLTVWAQGVNLWMLTDYLGMDPEFSASNNVLWQGVDGGWLSQGRMCYVGLKINL